MTSKVSFKLAALGCAGLLLAAGNAQAASTAVTNVVTAATVVAPMTITAASTLNFGTFAGSAALGTVIIPTVAARSATGGVTLIATSAGAASGITVAGANGATFTVVYPTTPQNITSGGATMTISAFNTSLSGDAGTVGAGGSATFTIGATLNVAANQATGVYSGTYPITLTYN